MVERKSAGEISQSCSQDETKYDNLEVAHALLDDTLEQLFICAEKYEKVFDEKEFFLVLLIASDPLIKNVRRHKYYAFLYLPSPRPQQVVFLYNKVTQKIRRIWSLPDAKVMATISTMDYVAPQWQETKGWCDAFFDGTFFEYIRKSNAFLHLSEAEFLDLHREELLKTGIKDGSSLPPQPFDFEKIKIDHIIDTKTARTEQ